MHIHTKLVLLSPHSILNIPAPHPCLSTPPPYPHPPPLRRFHQDRVGVPTAIHVYVHVDARGNFLWNASGQA